MENNSTFELLKTLHLNPSSKTIDGMDAVTCLIASGKVKEDELKGFPARTELQHLDNFAAKSMITGGPWRSGSVKVKMPHMRASKQPFFTEAQAPEYERTGIWYRPLVDLITSKIQETPPNSFLHTPFTEWWCPPGSTIPIRVYTDHLESFDLDQIDQSRGI